MWLWLWCWYDSRLRYQQANTALLTSQPGFARPRQHVITRQLLLGRTTRKPASRYSARTARYGSLLGRTTGRPANCDTNAPFKGQRFHSQLTRGNLHPASSITPGFSQLTATHYGPFQGQKTLQQESWHYENFARLPWSSVTLIVNICYSGCLRTRTPTSHITYTVLPRSLHNFL
jgi:hypothetical protein